uniref:Fatty acyl-CoA reductase C-terminal domain-containing protein n=1 Tax=Homalodisca liturata TaxID=320908 RepID=A0A1B6HDW6_9HEMI
MENNMESVPVDYAVNCMISTAWRTSMNRNSTSTSVYNFTTTPIKPILWKHLVEFALHNRDLWPFSRAIWYSSFIPTDSPLVHEILYWILQRIPGIFLDKVIQLAGGEPILGKIYGRIYNLTEHTGYYSRRNWEFRNDNVMDLWRDLTPEDKQLFYFDLRDVDVREHLLVGKLGIRYYYLKEEMENIPAAIRRNNYLRWLHRTTKAAFGLVVLKLLVVTARALPF